MTKSEKISFDVMCRKIADVLIKYDRKYDLFYDHSVYNETVQALFDILNALDSDVRDAVLKHVL